MKLANCRFCGNKPVISRHGRDYGAGCQTVYCCLGPVRSTETATIEAWNALMGQPSIPESAVEVKAHGIICANGEWAVNAYSKETEQDDIIYDMVSEEGYVSGATKFTITAHLVPPKVQEVEGRVEQ